MAKFSHAKNNFIAGELSPKLEGRNDIQEYFNGAATLQNFIPSREGGAMRRPGSVFVRNISADTAPNGGLYSFVVSKNESYVVSIDEGNSAIEIYKQTFTSQPVLTSVFDKTDVPVNVQTVINGSDPNKYNKAQVNNILFLTHSSGDVPPILIKRIAVDTFEVALYFEEVKTRVTAAKKAQGIVFPAVQTNTITMTDTGLNLTASAAYFTPEMAGGYVRIKVGAVESIYELNIYNSPTSMLASVIIGPSIVGAQTEWILNSWNNHNGWPRAISLYQQRLMFGGTKEEPTTIWCSRTENLFLILNVKLAQDSSTDVSGLDYFGPILNSDAFDITLTSNQSNVIQWMSSDRFLQVGTISAEYAVTTVDGKFGPANANAIAQTFFGSNDTSAVRAQNATIFISTDGKSVREIKFSEENGSNISRLLSVLSDQIVFHNVDPDTTSIFDNEFAYMAYQASRSCIWMLTSSGNLTGLIIEKSSNTLAWHKHVIGGTDVTIKGICVIPDDIGKYDTLYLNVERTIDGSPFTYIEAIGADYEIDKLFGHSNGDHRNYPYFSDSGFVATTFSHGAQRADVPHLAKENVSVMVRGKFEGIKEVKTDLGGSPYVEIDADTPLTYEVIVGIPYKSIIKSMIIEAGSRTGSALGQIKNLSELFIKLFRSSRLEVGSREDNTELIDLVETDPVQLFTGGTKVCVESTPGEDQRFYIETEDPFPLNVLSVVAEGSTQD